MARVAYKYKVKLKEAERQELEGLFRSGKTERRLAERARIILWADEGLSMGETAQRLGCSEQTILNWRRDFLARREEEGAVEALRDRPRSGRPPVFSPGADGTGQSHRL
jgi:DNA-directed RNA polymerase specialized sigma24 family protein